MCDPRIDHLCGSVVVTQCLDQKLSSTIELAAENAVRAVSLIEGAPAVFDLRAKMTRGVLVLEALDAASLRASEQEPDHHVLETAIDEVIDDRSELGFSAELLKQSHVRGDPGAMSGVDQVASLAHEITTTPEAPQAKVIDFFEALMARVEASQVKGKPKLKPLKKAAAKKSRKKKAASSKSK